MGVRVAHVYAWPKVARDQHENKGAIMKLKKFFLIVFATTCIALIYTQMQFNIYALAYHGKEREQKIIKLIDENSYTQYNIAKLKSANHLGFTIFTDQDEIGFLGSDQIVYLRAPEILEQEMPTRIASMTLPQRGIKFISRVFSLRAIAEARQIQ